jgi:hypothetical protein
MRKMRRFAGGWLRRRNSRIEATPHRCLTLAIPGGANMTQLMLSGAKYRFKDQNVYMPPFGMGYSDTELAAVANYVIAQFGGKTGRVTPEDVAKRRGE